MWRKLSLFTSVGMMTVFVIIIATSVVYAQSPVTPNLDAYCKSLGYVGFKQDSTQPNNPYGGGCVDANGIMHGMDMQAACRWQFGDVYPIAQYPDPMKPGWLCYPNNNTAPKPPPPMTPMSPTAVPQPQQSGGNSGSNPNPPPNTAPLHPDMQEPGGPGVKVPYGCGYDGHGWGTNQNQANAYDWRCPDGYLLGAADFQRFCQYAWGSLYPYVTLADCRNKYGWQCSSKPGYIDPLPQGGNAGNTGPSSGNTNCSSAPSRLSSGDTAWVSDADRYPLLVFDQPGRGTNQIFTVPIRQSVTIISGPVCQDNATWVQIRYNGNVGWAAEANHYGNYNLIPGTYGGGGSSGSPSSGAGISIPITLPGGISFSLQVVYDANSCVIQNGADLTVMEILNLQYQLNGKNWDDKLAIVIAYLQLDSGIAEQIRHRVENAIAGLASSCNASNARYQIGNQRMDLSGPGNIVFGYVMGAWGWDIKIENLISNGAQFIRDFGRKLSLRDEPDDICQRQVGRLLATSGPVDANTANRFASDVGCSLNQ